MFQKTNLTDNDFKKFLEQITTASERRAKAVSTICNNISQDVLFKNISCIKYIKRVFKEFSISEEMYKLVSSGKYGYNKFKDEFLKGKRMDVSGASHMINKLFENDPMNTFEKDSLIELAFALNMNKDECNELLVLCGYDQLHSRNLEEALTTYFLNKKTDDSIDTEKLFVIYFKYTFLLQKYNKQIHSDNRGFEFSDAISSDKESKDEFDDKIHITENTRNVHIHRKDKKNSQSTKILVDKIYGSLEEYKKKVLHTTHWMLKELTNKTVEDSKLELMIKKEIDSFCQCRNNPLKEILTLIKSSEYYLKEKKFSQLFDDIFEFYTIEIWGNKCNAPTKNIMLLSNLQIFPDIRIPLEYQKSAFKKVRLEQKNNFKKLMLKTLLGYSKMTREAYICLLLFFCHINNSSIKIDDINKSLRKSQYGIIDDSVSALNECDIFVKYWLVAHEKHAFDSLRESLEYITNEEMITCLDDLIFKGYTKKYPLSWYS